MDESETYTRLAFATCAALAVGGGVLAGGLAGCGSDSGGGDDGPDPDRIALHESRSSTIALAEDGSRVAMVNPDDGTLSVFQTSDHARLSKIATGKSPSSVVITADGTTAFVANRADGTVVRIRGIEGGTPAVDATAEVGAEPVALALSPTGKRLFVAEFADSRISVIDTATMQIVQSLPVDRPRALLVTNNADASEDDEVLAVTQFYGTPVAGREARDDGRLGKVRLYSLADLGQVKDITLAPLDSGFPKGGVATNPTITTSPNQLAALATANGKLFITSVSASPEGPTRFDNNVFPVVHVADLADAAEVTGAAGSTNLARKIYDANPTPSPASPRFIPGELSDIEFVRGSNVAYVLGRAGDVMVRVAFGASVDVGSTQNKQIDLAGNDTLGKCQGPSGLVIDGERQKAYVNCWLTRRMAIIDLGAQSMAQTVEASPAPANATELAIQRGKRFYFTGRGRWSAAVANGAKGGEGWSSCGSCHPDGLSDNITWVFAAGPRQTTSQDGSFSHGPGAQKQRIFNWTGIFDEHHDFERNTRDVSGGLGAITTAPTLADCNQLDKETQVSLAGIGGLAKPLKELADDAAVATCGHKDWDDIDSFVKTIAPVGKTRIAEPASVDRGRQLFVDGGCAKCHGGAGWTISRRMFTPASATNSSLTTTAYTRPTFFPATWQYDNNGQSRTQISAQPAIGTGDATGPAEPAAIAIAEVACGIRNVGTFGLLGDAAGTDALELRPANGALVRAQGRAGYNVPSLYGLALGAPYLHHGQAPTLRDLFLDSRWTFHTNAGNANFSVTLGQPGKLDDLTAFLLSIDATTPEIAVPTDAATGGSFDACP
ncbi:MAG: beta-propeller fold lactonase family protein [Myxococcota bacterium]|nr:beta-propeller fold lactonase family protein [Myxococcota bacterium]